LIKNIIKVLLILFLTTSGLLFVTKNSNYDTRPLETRNQVAAFKDEGIYVNAIAYTAEESKYYLQRDLVSRGYQPIQLTIQNNSSSPLGLGHLSVDLPLVSGNKIAFQFFKETLPRSIGLKIASLFFWPFNVPSAIDGIMTYRNQKIMRHDYNAKTIKNYEEIIPAYSTMNRILFVKREDFQNCFNLVLQNKESGLIHKYRLDIS
jgi:hypothetical protein